MNENKKIQVIISRKMFSKLLLENTLILFKKLKENGSFFNSAIELEHNFNGIIFEKEIDLHIKRLEEYFTKFDKTK